MIGIGGWVYYIPSNDGWVYYIPLDGRDRLPYCGAQNINKLRLCRHM